jgi:hypothetical protein
MKHISNFKKSAAMNFTFSFIAAFLFLACEKKSDIASGDTAFKIEAKQIILSRIESKKQNATEKGTKKLDQLNAGLDFENMWIEKESDSTKIIVVPAQISFETLSKLKDIGSHHLLITVNNKNRVIRENIVAYVPNVGAESKIKPGNFSAVLNKQNAFNNGLYIFLSFAGSYFYDFKYENGNLKQSGTPMKRTAKQMVSRTESETVCIDWWHVTYHYDENGYFLYKDEEYLYQTCHSCGEVTPWGQTLVCDYLNDDTGGGVGADSSLQDVQKTWTVVQAKFDVWAVTATERFSGINDPNQGGKQFTNVTHLGDNGYALVEGLSVTWVKQGVTTSHTAWTAQCQIAGKLTVVVTGSINVDPDDVFVDMQIDKTKNWLINEIWQ